MNQKPELTVKLFAGETLVDSSTDVALWQHVLAEIRGVQAPQEPKFKIEEPSKPDSPQVGGPLKVYAKEICVTVEELVGALDPRSESPFVYLDERCWEALKRNTPNRGPGSVSPAVLAATALVTWGRHQTIGDVTLQAVRAVMAAANLDDPNTSRSINNSNWLQLRNGRVVLNPAQLSAADRLLRAFCRKEALSGTT